MHLEQPYYIFKPNSSIDLLYRNKTIPQSTDIKFLGINLDCFLLLKIHPTFICSLVLRQSSMLNTIELLAGDTKLYKPILTHKDAEIPLKCIVNPTIKYTDIV